MFTDLNKSLFMKWAICIIVPFTIYLIPINDIYTEPMRAFFVVTLLAILIMAFELLHTMAISILLPLMYMVFVAPATTVFSGWMTTTPWVCLGAMFLASVLDHTGVLNRISYWCISRCGSYRMTVYGVLIVGVIISVMTGVMGGLLVYTFAFGIMKGFGLKKSNESAVIMFAAVFGTTTAEMFIYKPVFMSLINASAAQYVPGFMIEYLELIIANWPFFFLMILLLEIYIRMYKANISGSVKDEFAQKLKALGSMTLGEKKASGLTAFIVLYMLTSSFTGLPMDYGLMIFPWLAFLPGMNIGIDADVRSIQYDMIFFVMACMGIGGVAAYAGVATLVSDAFVSTIAPLGNFAAMFVIYLFGIILNFLMTPMAMLAAFLGPVVQIAQNLGINSKGLIYIFYAACDQIILPYEYANYLLAYSFGMMSLKHFLQMSLVKLGVGTIFIFTVMIGWWSIIGVL